MNKYDSKEDLRGCFENIRFAGGFFLILLGGGIFVFELELIDVGAASEESLLMSTLFLMIGLLLLGYHFGGLAISLVFVIGYIDSSTLYLVPLLISIITLLIFCASIIIKRDKQKKLLTIVRKGNIWE